MRDAGCAAVCVGRTIADEDPGGIASPRTGWYTASNNNHPTPQTVSTRNDWKRSTTLPRTRTSLKKYLDRFGHRKNSRKKLV